MLESNLLGKKKVLSKSLLMHFEGDDGSTAFKDEGGVLLNWSVVH